MAPIYDGGPMPYGPIPVPAESGRAVFTALLGDSGRDPPPPNEQGWVPAGSRPQLPAPPGLTPRATVTVRLPADARLYAEGQPLTHSGGEKTFVTPNSPRPGLHRVRSAPNTCGTGENSTRKTS